MVLYIIGSVSITICIIWLLYNTVKFVLSVLDEYRFNGGRCKKCNRVLYSFDSTGKIRHYGFGCKKCGYEKKWFDRT